MSKSDDLDPLIRRNLNFDADEITRAFELATWVFPLKAPGSLTIRIDGKYSKRPFIGEERFEGVRAYVGKSGKVICVFKLETNPKIGMEMPLNECLTKLQNFPRLVNEIQAKRDDFIVGKTRDEVETIEKMAHVEAKRDHFAENPAFGSW